MGYTELAKKIFYQATLDAYKYLVDMHDEVVAKEGVDTSNAQNLEIAINALSEKLESIKCLSLLTEIVVR